jgi:hypothetical protein
MSKTTQRSSARKPQPSRPLKRTILVPVVLAFVVVAGIAAAAIAKGHEAPAFSLQFSFQFSASNSGESR